MRRRASDKCTIAELRRIEGQWRFIRGYGYVSYAGEVNGDMVTVDRVAMGSMVLFGEPQETWRVRVNGGDGVIVANDFARAIGGILGAGVRQNQRLAYNSDYMIMGKREMINLMKARGIKTHLIPEKMSKVDICHVLNAHDRRRSSDKRTDKGSA